jgi:hypothetical protein
VDFVTGCSKYAQLLFITSETLPYQCEDIGQRQPPCSSTSVMTQCKNSGMVCCNYAVRLNSDQYVESFQNFRICSDSSLCCKACTQLERISSSSSYEYVLSLCVPSAIISNKVLFEEEQSALHVGQPLHWFLYGHAVNQHHTAWRHVYISVKYFAGIDSSISIYYQMLSQSKVVNDIFLFCLSEYLCSNGRAFSLSPFLDKFYFICHRLFKTVR